MTRWIAFGVIVVAASVGLAIGFPYITGGSGQVEPLIPESLPTAKPGGPQPKLVIEGPAKFDFGTMTQQESSEHEFLIRNEGKADLILTAGAESVTCSCTVVELPEKLEGKNSRMTLKPGETNKIKVSWQTKDFASNDWVREVLLETNDPESPKAKFAVGGKIFPPINVMPGETTLNFQTLNNSKEATFPLFLMSRSKPDLKVTEVVTTNPDVLAHSIRPFNAEEQKKFDAKQGVRVDVIVKKGANLGPFTDEVLVKTDHPKKPELKFNAVGRVEGPITMAPRWGIQMREVSAKKGGIQSVTMWVRDQGETKFEVVKKPSLVDVEIVPAQASEADKAPGIARGKKYDFTVKVKPNTPTGAVTDEILIKTNHPNAALLRVPVQVFVNSNG